MRVEACKTEFVTNWLDELKGIRRFHRILVLIERLAVTPFSLNIDLDLHYLHAYSCHYS